MENNRELIVKLLQNSLKNQLRPDSNFKPQVVADALIQRTLFHTPKNSVEDIRLKRDWKKTLQTQRDEMEGYYYGLSEDEKLLRNFVRGQITMCDKLIKELEESWIRS